MKREINLKWEKKSRTNFIKYIRTINIHFIEMNIIRNSQQARMQKSVLSAQWRNCFMIFSVKHSFIYFIASSLLIHTALQGLVVKLKASSSSVKRFKFQPEFYLKKMVPCKIKIKYEQLLLMTLHKVLCFIDCYSPLE